MDSIKLQKYFSDCGIMSRRAAEEEIKAGRVKVNGAVATLGTRISPDVDTVEYRGNAVSKADTKKICIMLNKPRGFITTLSDERGRRTVSELCGDVGARVYPIGRLDMDSDGLLLLTNDGDLANRLTHPRHEIPKIYRVTVKGRPDQNALDKLRSPLTIDGYKILPVQTDVISYSERSDETILQMTLYEGRNRQIRKMCAIAELTVTRLCRVAIGDILLGSLPVGIWRQLTDSEISYLKGENKKDNKT